MHVFVTGASGHLGSRITKLLLERGDTVSGLGRSPASFAKIEAIAGAQPVLGLLTDLALMKSEAAKADAVIHTAFNHEDFRTDIARVCAEDRACIQALADGLNENPTSKQKILIYTSGTFSTDGEDENCKKLASPYSPRYLSEQLTQSFDTPTLRGIAIRLAPIVHAQTHPHPFLQYMVPSAKSNGFVGYVDERGVWPAAHYDDVADLTVLALDKHIPVPTLHAVTENVSTKDIAGWVAQQLNLPVQKVPQSEAMEKLGFMGMLLGIDNPTTSKLTQEWTGWHPHRANLLEELKGLKLETS